MVPLALGSADRSLILSFLSVPIGVIRGLI
jgi:hypothetical protein